MTQLELTFQKSGHAAARPELERLKRAALSLLEKRLAQGGLKQKEADGLLRREAPKYKHGHSIDGTQTPTYRSWYCMLQRCTNPKNKRFKNYGGRGISFCARWKTFANFLLDMGECPPGMTIGRIDNDGDYKPANCEWQPKAHQARNTTRTFWLTFDGIKRCSAEWARSAGIDPGTFNFRIRRWGRLPSLKDTLEIWQHRLHANQNQKIEI